MRIAFVCLVFCLFLFPNNSYSNCNNIFLSDRSDEEVEFKSFARKDRANDPQLAPYKNEDIYDLVFKGQLEEEYSLSNLADIISFDDSGFPFINNFFRQRIPDFSFSEIGQVILKTPYSARQRVTNQKLGMEISLPLVKLDVLTDITDVGSRSNLKYSIFSTNESIKNGYLGANFSIGVVGGKLCFVSEPLRVSSQGDPIWDPYIFFIYQQQYYTGLRIAVTKENGNYRLVLPMNYTESLDSESSRISENDLVVLRKKLDLLISQRAVDIQFEFLKGTKSSIDDIEFYVNESVELLIIKDEVFPVIVPLYSNGPQGKARLSDNSGESETLIVPANGLNTPNHLLNWVFGNVLNKLLHGTGSGKAVYGYLRNILKDKKYAEWFMAMYYLSFENSKKLDAHLKFLGLENHISRMSLKAIGWVSEKSLRRHFKKHGAKEMGLHSEKDYLQAALDFFHENSSTALVFYRKNSATFFKFDLSTNEVGVLDKDGNVITYFINDESYRSREEISHYIGENIIEK